jgi:hypothetical protein
VCLVASATATMVSSAARVEDFESQTRPASGVARAGGSLRQRTTPFVSPPRVRLSPVDAVDRVLLRPGTLRLALSGRRDSPSAGRLPACTCQRERTPRMRHGDLRLLSVQKNSWTTADALPITEGPGFRPAPALSPSQFALGERVINPKPWKQMGWGRTAPLGLPAEGTPGEGEARSEGPWRTRWQQFSSWDLRHMRAATG